MVESVAYQRTLAWLLRTAMSNRREYFPVEEVVDRRKKMDRILDSFNGLAAARRLFIRAEHHEFIDQFKAYPDVPHDDILDAGAMAVKRLMVLDGLAHANTDDNGRLELPAPPPRPRPATLEHVP